MAGISSPLSRQSSPTRGSPPPPPGNPPAPGWNPFARLPRDLILTAVVFLLSLFHLVLISFLAPSSFTAVHLTPPLPSEQPAASLISESSIPRIPLVSSLIPELPIFLFLAHLAALSFNILYTTTGSFLASFAFSQFLIFDSPTLSMAVQNKALAIHMAFVAWAIRAAHFLDDGPRDPDIEWFTDFFVSLLSISTAIFIRPEAAAATLLLIPSVHKYATHDLSKLLNRTRRYFSDTIPGPIVAGFALLLLAIGVRLIGFPLYVLRKPTVSGVFRELATNPHNLTVLVLAPVAFGFLFFAPEKVAAWGQWLLVTAVCVEILPIAAVVDDLVVRTALARFVLALAVGTAFGERAGWVWGGVAMAALGATVWLFVYPVQPWLWT
jgi:hypothetical protein